MVELFVSCHQNISSMAAGMFSALIVYVAQGGLSLNL